MKKTRRTARIVIALVIVGVVMAAASAGWALLRQSKPIPPEKLVRAERGNIARSVVAIGHIEALSKVQVKSKANGIIQGLLADVGDRVKEAQILAELDKDDPQALAREAKATVEAEEANLRMAESTEAKARIEATNPELGFRLARVIARDT